MRDEAPGTSQYGAKAGLQAALSKILHESATLHRANVHITINDERIRRIILESRRKKSDVMEGFR